MEVSFCSGRYIRGQRLQDLQGHNPESFLHTLGSDITPGVWTCTILCRSLMQHTLTPMGAVSMRFRIFDLIATMFCHVAASSGRDILLHEILDRFD